MSHTVVALLAVLCLAGCNKTEPPPATPSYYQRLPAAPTACPTRVDPGLEPFYRHCHL